MNNIVFFQTKQFFNDFVVTRCCLVDYKSYGILTGFANNPGTLPCLHRFMINFKKERFLAYIYTVFFIYFKYVQLL